MAAHLNVYNTGVFYIDEGIRRCRLYISLNGNIHRLRYIGQIDRNITSVISPGDLVIAAFIDGNAFRRIQFSRWLRYLPAQLRHFQAYPPPEQVH